MSKILSRTISLILCAVFILSAASQVIAIDSTTPGQFIFDSENDLSYFSGAKNTVAAYSETEGALSFTATGTSCDPYVYFNIENQAEMSADEYKYLVLTYRSPFTNTTRAGTCQLYLCAGSVTSPTEGQTVNTTLNQNDKFVSAVINLSAVSGWTGTVHGFRYDYFSDCTEGDTIYLSSFCFARTQLEANEIATVRTALANGETISEVRTYDFKSENDISVISAGSASALPGDVNSDGTVSLKDSLLIKKYLLDNSVEINLEAADIDGDGEITTKDIKSLKKHLLGKEEIKASGAAVSFDGDKAAACVTALADGASFRINLDKTVNTEQFKYAILTYILPESEATNAGVTFGNTPADITLVADGVRRCIRIQLSGSDFSEVQITTSLNSGESIYVDSLIFTETLEDAVTEASLREESEIIAEGTRLIFDSESSLESLSARNSTALSYSAAANAAAFTVSGSAGDPQVGVDYTPYELYANNCQYIVITYMIPTTAAFSSTLTELFMCAGTYTDAAAGVSVQFTPVKDGAYHTQIIPLSGYDWWSGKINLIRFDYFSTAGSGDTMYVDSVCFTKTKSAAAALGKERLALRNGGEAQSLFKGEFSYNGKNAEMTVYDALSQTPPNGYVFSGQMTAVLPSKSAPFNRFSLNYATNTIVRGIAYYTVGNTEVADEFFLENTSGQTKTFSSIITDYFDGKYAKNLSMIEFYTINTSSSALIISGVTTEDYGYVDMGTFYLSNSTYRLGVDFHMGGGINYFEYFNDNNPNYGNLLNNADVGRLVQQSYYGIDKAPYPLGNWSGSPWGYNPVQGGDKVNNPSRIVDFEFRSDNVIYVKARPMDWGQVNMATPSYMENIYTLTDDYLHVYNRFIDFSGYTHTQGWQELPAFYTISALNNFYYYNGSSPWTNDTLIKRSDLVFWGAVSNQAFDLKSTSEFWSAWTDDSGMGVGLYVPGVYTYHAGKFGYDGSCDPAAGSCNYVAPRRYLTLVCGKPLEYSYLVTAGNISEIRDTFKENRGLINNSGLENYN